jgi:hypothetical protein
LNSLCLKKDNPTAQAIAVDGRLKPSPLQLGAAAACNSFDLVSEIPFRLSGCGSRSERIVASNRRGRTDDFMRVAARPHRDLQQFSLRVENFVSIERQDRSREFTVASNRHGVRAVD